MFRSLLQMTGLDNSCTRDCSGRGECLNGTCMCEIRFTGDICDGPNVPYHVAIGGLFFAVGFVCAVQLIMAIVSEYQRMKAPTFLKACRVTTQKLIYFVMCIASLIRGAYFISPDYFEYDWSSSLLSSYYPLLMSSASLIVCFWAEVFHLQGIRWEKAHFLSKSFLGFVTFNIISYSLLFAEVITTTLAEPPPDDPSLYKHLFNGCYAVLLFIVVVFFLIYGVEVFFKVRGGFVTKQLQLTNTSSGHHHHNQIDNNCEVEPLRSIPTADELRPEINVSQLHQSRIGLISQAFMLITIVGFLFSETLSEFWKTKVPIVSRNWHDVVFRIVEIGVAVWFPAVLWNCMQPHELWILNPQKLLATNNNNSSGNSKFYDQQGIDEPGSSKSGGSDEAFLNDGTKRECWICYDNDKPEPLIQPCACTGDVSSVHHDCLRRWLMESSSVSGAGANAEQLKCKVCNYNYDVCSTTKLDWERGFTAKHWGSTAVIVTCLCVVVAAAWIAIQLFPNSYIRMLSASIALLVIYICVKFLGQNTLSAYQRARVAALNISNHVTTISGTVNVETNDTQPQAAL